MENIFQPLQQPRSLKLKNLSPLSNLGWGLKKYEFIHAISCYLGLYRTLQIGSYKRRVLHVLPPELPPINNLVFKVGLRLLLSPVCSNVVIRTACCTVGTILPVYSTFKAIETSDQQEREKWLVYWTAYGTFELVEVFSDKLIPWVPFYYHMKFAFLVWLQLPSTLGADVLYRKYVRPFLMKHQAKFDLIVRHTSQEIGKLLGAYQSEVQCLKAFILNGVTLVNQLLKEIGESPSEKGKEGPNSEPARPTHQDSSEADNCS